MTFFLGDQNFGPISPSLLVRTSYFLVLLTGVMWEICQNRRYEPRTFSYLDVLKNEVRSSTKLVPVRTLEDDDFPTLHQSKVRVSTKLVPERGRKNDMR